MKGSPVSAGLPFGRIGKNTVPDRGKRDRAAYNDKRILLIKNPFHGQTFLFIPESIKTT